MSESKDDLQLIDFPGRNVVFGEGQPEYLPLPACRIPDDLTGTICFKWRLTWRQRVRLLFTGALWHEVLTFNHPLQPQRLSLMRPKYLEGSKP